MNGESTAVEVRLWSDGTNAETIEHIIEGRREEIALLKNEHDEALRKSVLDQKQCDEMTSEAARLAEEIAALQNEKELVDEHLRLDTILNITVTWEKALKKREEDIAALTDKLHSAHQYYNIALDEWQHCIEEIATLKEKVNQLVIADF